MNDNQYKNQFNIYAEAELAKRISHYKLNQNEAEQVWALLSEKGQQKEKLENDFSENKGNLVNNEYDRLRGDQRPQPGLQPSQGPKQNLDKVLLRQANNNVEFNHNKELSKSERGYDQKINQVFENKQQREKENAPNLKRDFDQARDQ